MICAAAMFFFYSRSTMLLPNAHHDWYGPPTPQSPPICIVPGTKTMVNLWHTIDRRSTSYVCKFFGRAYISGNDCNDISNLGMCRS